MHLEIIVAALLLVILNSLFAIKAFNDGRFMKKARLHVDGILISKQYPRLVSAGFVHESGLHLFFHSFVLLCASLMYVEHANLATFLLAFTGGLLGGNLLTLHLHRHQGGFHSQGLAPAISGVLTAGMVLYPQHLVQVFFLPIYLPAWAIGLMAIGYSLFGLRTSRGRILYEEHLGGMIAGGSLCILLHPHAVHTNPVPVLGFMIASALFLFLIERRSSTPSVFPPIPKPVEAKIIVRAYHVREVDMMADKETELNFLLDEVKRTGLQGLSHHQKRRLDELSRDPEL